jgi:hypothetical protein
MQKAVAIICLWTIIFSCKEQSPFIKNRLKTTEKFMECLRNNTPDKILEYTYPDADYKINNKESRDFYVNKASQLVRKFGLPPKDKWIIKYDPKNNFERLLITIPIFKGHDTLMNLLEADIVIAFPPPQLSDKIFTYEIRDKYDIDRAKPLDAPQLDTIKRK